MARSAKELEFDSNLTETNRKTSISALVYPSLFLELEDKGN